VGEQPPGTAASRQRPEGIENFTCRVFLRSAPSFGRGHERLNQLPCSIREVCWVRLSGFHAPNYTLSSLASGDFFNTLSGYLHILDYKPDAAKETHAVTQLTIYAMALSRRTGLPVKAYKCA
jgi:hypothetical protein